jgi:hypothetical protein
MDLPLGAGLAPLQVPGADHDVQAPERGIRPGQLVSPSVVGVVVVRHNDSS